MPIHTTTTPYRSGVFTREPFMPYPLVISPWEGGSFALVEPEGSPPFSEPVSIHLVAQFPTPQLARAYAVLEFPGRIVWMGDISLQGDDDE